MASKITIIIPIYNAEKYLHRCLDSVLHQTFPDWTAILVDDGSSDGSGKIADEYAEKDERFIVIHKKNGGVSDARNVGMKQVRSEYVMFLDSDDFIHPQALEITYNLAQKYNTDLLSFSLNKVNSGAIPQHFETFDKFDYMVTDNVLKYATEAGVGHLKYVIHRTYICGKLYKTSVVKDILFPQNVRICEDFQWLSDCYAKNPKTLILNLPLYYYVQNDASAVNSISGIEYIKCVYMGIKHGNDVFKNNKYKKLYMKHIIWPFIYSIVRTIRSMDNDKERVIAISYLKDIYDCGVCSRPFDLQSIKYYFRIKRILKYSAK